jgi:Putative peptidoglycan binding domain/L,D-transpeptidase catalytic domain/PKD domain
MGSDGSTGHFRRTPGAARRSGGGTASGAFVRRFVLVSVLFLIWTPAAHAKLNLTVQATPAQGQAPLDVTLTAAGDAIAYHWDLGDSATADGAIVRHRYEAGRYTATVTATGGDGTTEQASVVVTALRITLSGPRAATYGRRTRFNGRVFPPVRGAPVALYAGESSVRSVKADRRGKFGFHLRLRSATTLTARFGGATSNAISPAIRPALDVAFPRTAMVGGRLVLRAKLRPTGSGTLRLRIWRSGHELRPRTFGRRAVLRLSTKRVGDYLVRIAVRPKGTFRARKTTLRSSIYYPYLSLGARGASVRILERRLAELRYALRGVDSFYSYDTADAVLAFQKVNGLARTGRVDPAVWRRLRSAHPPRPRYRYGHHLEVDKSRQVLFEVSGGRVVRVVHVSTGATGNTPVGRFRVYSKVPGFLPTGMFYSSFFLRGFAIHGYASVPPYPASHGCVRIPMWVAPSLFSSNSYGESVYVYY